MPAIETTCPECRRHLPPGARFCAGCGTRVAQAEAITYVVSDRRTFGVMPGRAQLRAARTRSKRWLAVADARVRLAVQIVMAHLEAAWLRLQLTRCIRGLQKDRGAAYRALGEAVFHVNGKEAERAKAHLTRLAAGIADAEAQLRLVDERLKERIEAARAEGGATAMVEPVPEPPMPVPEPSPVPSDPPGPVVVPEPEPAPHEPPGPVIVPEPEPPGAA